LSIKVYLDSNVIMRLVLRKDKTLEKIITASRDGKLETYVSWLSLMEISKPVSRMANHQKTRTLDRINEELDRNKIHILAEFDPSLSSGATGFIIPDFDYADYLHLLVASRVNVNYFVTYDKHLLSKGQFESFKILDPGEFVRQVLEAEK